MMVTKPTPFGPFLLLRRLGTGGMAETYLAERLATRKGDEGPSDFTRLVCVKLILPEHSADKNFVGWFFDEANIHARLHHDNMAALTVAAVLAFGANRREPQSGELVPPNDTSKERARPALKPPTAAATAQKAPSAPVPAPVILHEPEPEQMPLAPAKSPSETLVRPESTSPSRRTDASDRGPPNEGKRHPRLKRQRRDHHERHLKARYAW